MATAPHFPLRVFYDGACPVCSREIRHYHGLDHGARLIPVDISANDFNAGGYGLAADDFLRELHAIDGRGTIYRGVDAFQAIWRAFPDQYAYRILAAVIGLPIVRPVARAAYRWFARLRPHLPGRDVACAAHACHPDRSADMTSKGEER